MFPHPQNLITVRAMERERLIAQVARERQGTLDLPRRARARAQNVSILRRAARAIAAFVG